jgi:hypothetical protein
MPLAVEFLVHHPQGSEEVAEEEEEEGEATHEHLWGGCSQDGVKMDHSALPGPGSPATPCTEGLGPGRTTSER